MPVVITEQQLNAGYCPLCRKFFTGRNHTKVNARRGAVLGHIRGKIQYNNFAHSQLTREDRVARWMD